MCLFWKNKFDISSGETGRATRCSEYQKITFFSMLTSRSFVYYIVLPKFYLYTDLSKFCFPDLISLLEKRVYLQTHINLYQLICDADWSTVTNVNNTCTELYSIINNIFEVSVHRKTERRRRFPVFYIVVILLAVHLKKRKTHKDFRKYKRQFFRDNLMYYERLQQMLKTIFQLIQLSFWSFVNIKKLHSGIPGTVKRTKWLYCW